MKSFENRIEAGKKLAWKLQPYANRNDVIVLGLPRGGVPVASMVAAALNAPLDVFIVRKIGVPSHPELAMGAISSGGFYHLNEEVIRRLYLTEGVIAEVMKREEGELKRRERLYRADKPPLDLRGRRVILVDDGLATGASMLAAVGAVKRMEPKEVIVAVPVIAASTIPEIRQEVDELVYVLAPNDFFAVGQWYANFDQTSDDEVQHLLSESGHSVPRETGITTSTGSSAL